MHLARLVAPLGAAALLASTAASAQPPGFATPPQVQAEMERQKNELKGRAAPMADDNVVPANGKAAAGRPATRRVADTAGEIQQASFLQKAPPQAAGAERPAARIIARVDKEVVLLEEVLTMVRGVLEEAQQKMPADQYKKYEWELVKKVTNDLIDQKILVHELEIFIPDKMALPRVKEMMAKEFESTLTKRARSMGMKSREEFLAQAKKEGVSFEALRKNTIEQQLGWMYLDQVVKKNIPEPTRDDLLAFYHEHVADFKEEAGATWRHLQVAKGADPAAARAKIDGLRGQIAAGADFGELAKANSIDPGAPGGGLYPKTRAGSFIIDAVDKALFQIPVGQVSPVIESPGGYHLVKVEKRTDGSPKPFSEVQATVKIRLMNERRRGMLEARLKEARAKHFVETIFDTPVAAAN